MILGITGSSGAGKSTICEILESEYTVKIINADKIAKKLSQKGTSYMRDIITKFGSDIVDEEGNLKRKKLAQIIYSDAEKRKELNNCTFKYIKKEIENQIQLTQRKEANTTIMIDAPLLFECKLDKLCDKVMGVISKRELQIERIVARDDIDYETAEKRLNAQESNDFYLRRCDVIIENNNNIGAMEKEIKKIAEECGMVKKY